MDIRVLYIAEIVGKAGIQCVKQLLPEIKSRHSIDFVIGNINGACDGCMPGLAEMYQEYIDGKKEIREINMQFVARYESGYGERDKKECSYSL